MDFNQAKDLLLIGLLGLVIAMVGAIVGVGTWAARKFLDELRALRESVESLNVNVAVIVTRTDGHEARISKLESDQ